MLEMSAPGVDRCPSSAVAKGLLRPLPSNATLSGCVAKVMKNPGSFADARESGRRQPNAAAGEGVVAAGVEKDEMASFSLAEFGEHGIERNRPRRDVVGLVQLSADGDEVVAASELKAVSGIVEQRHVGVGRLQREFVDGALHGGEIEIELERDLESQRLQRRGDILRVVRRIGERGDILVGAVADDEREAGLRPRRQGGERDEGEERRRD